MATQELPEARPPAVLTLLETLLLLHEGSRIRLELLANFRVLLQILLQCRMALHEMLVVHERWILAQLLGDFRMAIEESVSRRQPHPVFAAIELLFLLDVGAGIRLELLTYFRILLQVLLQLRMFLHEARIVYKRWILPQLLGDFRMGLE